MTSLLTGLSADLEISRSGMGGEAENPRISHIIDSIENETINHPRICSSITRFHIKTVGILRYACFVIQIALFILQAAPAARSQPGPLPRFIAPARISLDSLSARGDFDRDRRVDRAEFHQTGRNGCIHVKFGNQREIHISFINAFSSRGTLLSEDVDNDNQPDLIWVFHYSVLPALVWLGDGLGHFSSQAGIADLNALIFGYSGARIVQPGPSDETLSLTGILDGLGFDPTVKLRAEFPALFVGGVDHRRDLGLYLSYLYERGPPHLST